MARTPTPHPYPLPLPLPLPLPPALPLTLTLILTLSLTLTLTLTRRGVAAGERRHRRGCVAFHRKPSRAKGQRDPVVYVRPRRLAATL